MTKGKNITITCTKKQALLIELCLDYCSRISAGQLRHLTDVIELGQEKEKVVILPDGEEAAGYKLGSWIEDLIKPTLFPELARHASYGIGCKEIPGSQIMYEMIKCLQNYRSKNHKKGCFCVMHNGPLKYSKEPLITIKEEGRIPHIDKGGKKPEAPSVRKRLKSSKRVPSS